MARKLVNTKEISHDEWLSIRRKSLGGSEIGAVIGMNAYSSPLRVYALKKCLVNEKETTEAMRLGTDLESYVAERYMEKTGNKVRNDYWMYMDDELDYLTANIDRRIVGENAGLECKVMGNGAASYNFEIGEVPAHYYAQCQFYCMILGFDRVDLAILVLQRGIEVVPIERDDDFIADMRSQAIDFWENCILKNHIPAVDGSEADIATLKELYPEERKDTQIKIPGLDALVSDYKHFADLEKDYKERKTRLQSEICARLGPNEIGYGETVGVSWKSQTKPYADLKKLKVKYPAVYKDVVDVSKFRVFRTKKIGGK